MINQGDLIPASQQFMRQSNSQKSNLIQKSDRSQLSNQMQQSNPQQHQQLQQYQQEQQELYSQNNSQSHSAIQGSPQAPIQLLDMAIDLGNGNVQQIKVFENQSPYEVAERFCEDNELTKEAVDVLAQNIENNLREVLEEKEQKRYEEEQQRIQQNNNSSPEQQQYEEEEEGEQIMVQQQYSSNKIPLKNSKNGNIHINSNIDTNQYVHENHDIQEFEDEQQQQQQQLNSKSSQKYNNMNTSENNFAYQNINMFHVSPSKQQDFQSFQPNFNSTFSEGNLYGSKKMMKSNPRGNIHDRLYNDAQSKKIRQEQRAQNQMQIIQQNHKSIHADKKSSKRQFGNYELNVGEYLYYQAQQRKDETIEHVQRQKFEEMQKDEENLTFHPKISQKSVKLAEQKKQNQQLPEERFELDQKIRQEKQEKMKNQLRNQQLQTCSFHPRINKISAKIMEEKQRQSQYSNNDKFEQLYHDAKNRNIKKFNEKQKFEEIMKTKPSFMNRPPVNDDGTPFLERMERNIKEKHERTQHLEQLQQQQSLEMEKSELQFKPSVGRAPQFERNSEGLPIGEYLYRQQELSEQKQLFKYQQQLEFEQSQMFKKGGNSAQIIEEKKRGILNNIFDTLDSDGDGLISKQSINLTGLDPEILQILAEFLHEMEKQNIQYDFENFYQDVLTYLSNQPFSERDKIFFNYKRKWDQKKADAQEKSSYKPQINEKSSRMMEKTRDRNVDLYLLGQERLHNKKEKILQEQQNQLNKEMGECSFKPVLYKPIGIYSFSHISPKSHKKQMMMQQEEEQENESFENQQNNLEMNIKNGNGNNFMNYLQNQNEQQQLQQFSNDEQYIRDQENDEQKHFL